jgi:hypothetical protein
VLSYATDDDQAAATAERPILQPDSARCARADCKMWAGSSGPDGESSQGRLNGALLDVDEARSAVAAATVA